MNVLNMHEEINLRCSASYLTHPPKVDVKGERGVQPAPALVETHGIHEIRANLAWAECRTVLCRNESSTWGREYLPQDPHEIIFLAENTFAMESSVLPISYRSRSTS